VVVRIESVAHIRLLGPVRLTVDLDYEMIEGDELGPSEAPGSGTFIARTATPPGGHPRPGPQP
jgi:hypothetical protein